MLVKWHFSNITVPVSNENDFKAAILYESFSSIVEKRNRVGDKRKM